MLVCDFILTKPKANFVAVALEETRGRVKNLLVRKLPKLGMPKCDMTCDNSNELYMSELCAAFDCQVWPPDFHNIVTIRRALEILRGTDYLNRDDDTCDHLEPQFGVSHAELLEFAAEIEAQYAGLCVKCVKDDQKLLYEKCTVPKHSWRFKEGT